MVGNVKLRLCSPSNHQRNIQLLMDQLPRCKPFHLTKISFSGICQFPSADCAPGWRAHWWENLHQPIICMMTAELCAVNLCHQLYSSNSILAVMSEGITDAKKICVVYVDVDTGLLEHPASVLILLTARLIWYKPATGKRRLACLLSRPQLHPWSLKKC